MPLRRTLKPLLLLILATLACGFPAPSTEPTPLPASAVSATPSSEPEQALPVSLSRAVSAGVEAGSWTEAEGLIRGLRYLTGEVSAEEIFGDQPLMSAEGTRVVRRAQVYLADPANSEGRDEMARLLAMLVPSRETLDRFSQPASAARLGPGLARPGPRPPGDSVECRRLWLNGFEREEDGSQLICLEYDEIRVGGLAHRIYYPSYWEANAPERALLEPTRDALRRSLETYNGYGPRPVVGTDIVFTDLGAVDESGPRDDVLAAADEILHAERCHVAVFPTGAYVALRDDAAGDSGGQAFGVLLQTIAHELFHCYQYTNLAEQESGPDGDAADWWIEGSAEYFGSVVYPSVNAEFGYLGRLDGLSVNTSLIFIDYPAYAFFEYLDAQGGMSPRGVITDILLQMPQSGGYDEQQAALSGVPGMADAFHYFGQAYLDKQLHDLGGGTLPVHPQEGDASDFPIGPGEAHFAADPFVLHRYRLRFAENARFTVAQETQGESHDSARPVSAPGAWSEIPQQLDTACGDSQYVLLFTSVVPPGGDEVRLDLRTTGEEAEEGQPCDECIVGTWVLDNASAFLHATGESANADSGIAGTGVSVSPKEILGVMRLTFLPGGTARGAQEGWGLTSQLVGPDGQFETAVSYTGSGSAAWKVDVDEDAGQRILTFERGEFDLIAEIFNQGVPVVARPMDESNAWFFLSGAQPFACTATALTYNADDPLGPIVFHRGTAEAEAP